MEIPLTCSCNIGRGGWGYCKLGSRSNLFEEDITEDWFDDPEEALWQDEDENIFFDAANIDENSLFDTEEFDQVYAAYTDAKQRMQQIRQSRGFYPVVVMVDQRQAPFSPLSSFPTSPSPSGKKGKGKKSKSKSSTSSTSGKGPIGKARTKDAMTGMPESGTYLRARSIILPPTNRRVHYQPRSECLRMVTHRWLRWYYIRNPCSLKIASRRPNSLMQKTPMHKANSLFEPVDGSPTGQTQWSKTRVQATFWWAQNTSFVTSVGWSPKDSICFSWNESNVTSFSGLMEMLKDTFAGWSPSLSYWKVCQAESRPIWSLVPLPCCLEGQS